MTLAQKMSEVEHLTLILRDGWDKKAIFNVKFDLEEVGKAFYKTSDAYKLKTSVVNGWYPLLSQLGSHLEIQIFIDDRNHIDGERRVTSPALVCDLLCQAEAFIRLMKTRT